MFRRVNVKKLRHGGSPVYEIVNKLFEEGRTKDHYRKQYIMQSSPGRWSYRIKFAYKTSTQLILKSLRLLSMEIRIIMRRDIKAWELQCYIMNWVSVLKVKFLSSRDNAVEVLSSRAMSYLLQFGPQAYPFTRNIIQKLKALHQQLPKKTSILDILGSESRNYLINRRPDNRIPISRLQDMDVLLYACRKDHPVRLIKYLREIYTYYRAEKSFEIVSIPFDYNGGPQDEIVFNKYLAETPWLSLPFGDDKIWSLRDMMSKHACAGEVNSHPVLFIKPRGASLLDPYGCHVIKEFGIQPYPFTPRGAAHYLMIKQKKLTFESLLKETSHMSLNFISLIQNKGGGGTEEVHLSNIIGKKPTEGVLLFFASLESCPKERLDSLVAAYTNMKKSSS